MTRCDALSLIGGLSAAALVGGCSSADGGTGQDSGASESSGTISGPDSGTGTCILYPQQTEGPYYLDLDLLRRDLAQGQAGTPLSLAVQVLSANGCVPLKDVAVDIWHCDAAGIYSGYPGQLGGLNTAGQNFLRGTQITDEDGRVHFDTIYPGWYPGRTTHIHFKVHRSPTSEATSQMYFPEDLTAAIYQTPPYSAHGQKDTSNARDSVARGNLPPLLTIEVKDNAYLAALTITVAA